MTALSVNVNKVALLRNARGGSRPDVVACSRTVLETGADGITVHPRPDGRHIRTADVHALKELLEGFPHAEFNIEGNPHAAPGGGYPGFDQLVDVIRPRQCTLVPDADDQLTSDHGWDLTDASTRAKVAQSIARYRSHGVRVSLFMDPLARQIEYAKEVGADRIELYTGPYAQLALRRGLHDSETDACWASYRDAARCADELGLGVNAGHDLDLHNLPRFLAIGGIAEVSVGQALIADALELGLASTVKRYLEICARP